MPDTNPKARPAATRETEIADDRRRQLVSTAASLFEDGYHSTSLNDLARAVGISKPTIYHYFGSKEEILFWIHEEFIDVLISREQERAALELTPSNHLLAIMEDILELMASHRGHVRTFFEHYRELSAPRRRKIKAKRDEYEAAVRGVIARGIEDGSFRAVDTHLATLALAGMCNWGYQWYSPGGTKSTHDIAQEFFSIFMHGIAESG